MPATSRLRLAIAATPLLLADSLASLVPEGVDVTLIAAPTTERFDLAIVTPDSPQVAAELVIVLDSDPAATGGGSLEVAGGAEVRRLADLGEVIAVIAGFRHTGGTTDSRQ